MVEIYTVLEEIFLQRYDAVYRCKAKFINRNELLVFSENSSPFSFI